MESIKVLLDYETVVIAQWLMKSNIQFIKVNVRKTKRRKLIKTYPCIITVLSEENITLALNMTV